MSKAFSTLPRKGAALSWLIIPALMLLVAGCGGGGGSSGGSGGGGASSSSSSSTSSSVAPVPLAQVTIVTDANAPILDKVTYVGATISIPAIDGNPAFSGRTGIRGRGNSTWDLHPKKPYRLKLDSKASLLGMPKDKNWVLLANYSDKTLLRNRVAFEISRRLGVAWTPKAKPVEVTLNGTYLGVYDLVEQVRVAPDRVNITEIDDKTVGDPADGGYLMEINERMDDPVCWRTTKGVAVCLKAPDPSSTAQADYFKTYLQSAEDSLYQTNPLDPVTGYESFFEVNALIDWYLVNELFKNVDSASYSSIYLYKDKGTKLKFGPVWDFDLGAGNTNYFDSTPQGFQTATGVWIGRMKAADPTFEARIKARWKAIKATQIDTIPDYINLKAAELADAQARNFNKWPILNQYVWPNPEVAGTYQGEVDYFRNWMTARIAWMDANL